MRFFPYWTVGRIIETLKSDGFTTFNRMSYRNLENRGVIPTLRRTSGNWRVAKSTEEALEIMKLIWANTFGEESGKDYYAQLKTRYIDSGTQ